jgi:phosphoribosyl 1,2-cyclic phosphodiesterase
VDVYFCGTRGSMPAPGAPYVRYGGHTSCVGLARAGEQPSLVLDAGTGLVNLDAALGPAAFQGTLLLGHLLPALAYLGHSCPEYAISLAAEAGARQVCLFHHAPRRTDDALDELAARYADGAIPVFAARDGLTVRLAPGR